MSGLKKSKKKLKSANGRVTKSDGYSVVVV